MILIFSTVKAEVFGVGLSHHQFHAKFMCEVSN
jgi:hypothetical protein